MNKSEMKPGAPCSKNFVFEKRIDSVEELDKVLANNPSVFWRFRPFPCAVIIHQSLAVLKNSINAGSLWTIKHK